MKVLKTSNNPTHLELEIIIVVDISVSDSSSLPVVAAKHNVELEYRDLLKAEWQLTPAELATYRSFLISMTSIIESYGFEIVDEYQSNESYSYYIQFTPALYPGVLDNPEIKIPKKQNSDVLLDVKFRLSNHYEDGEAPLTVDSLARSSSKGYMFKEFVVQGVKHDSINSAIVDLQEICQELCLGNYSRLYKNMTY